jgi:hypothetical protein
MLAAPYSILQFYAWRRLPGSLENSGKSRPDPATIRPEVLDMHRFIRLALPLVLGWVLAVPLASQQPNAGRALKIEDYYRIQSAGNPSISDDGHWVAFTVTSRIEDDKESNKSLSEGWLVPFEGTAKPTRIQADGSVTNLRWLEDNWLQYTVDRQQWKIDPSKPSDPVRVGQAPPENAAQGRGRGGPPPSGPP